MVQLYQFSDEIAAHYNNAGVRCIDIGDLEQALLNFNESLRFKPDQEQALHNRQAILSAIGGWHEKK